MKGDFLNRDRCLEEIEYFKEYLELSRKLKKILSCYMYNVIFVNVCSSEYEGYK